MPGEDPQGPRFKSFPRSATVDKNGSASFACEMERPPKSATWMKDGKELREVPMKTRLTSEKTRKVSKQSLPHLNWCSIRVSILRCSNGFQMRK